MTATETPSWRLAGGRLTLERPRVMGILNLTPDSFSDGGRLPTLVAAMARAEALVAAGADLLDVGGESTRPGAEAVPAAEEAARVLPFVREAARAFPDVPLSIDTRKAEVAAGALAAGASIVNDVSAMAHDPDMAGVVARSGAGVVLMHMRGTPADMVERARYHDVVGEVKAELAGRLQAALRAGVPPDAVVLDPGLGFAKTASHSLTVLARLRSLAELGAPLLVGPSRKSFIGAVLGVPPEERTAGTVAACVLAYLHGARIFRVHDVGPVAQALALTHAVERAGAADASADDHGTRA